MNVTCASGSRPNAQDERGRKEDEQKSSFVPLRAQLTRLFPFSALFSYCPKRSRARSKTDATMFVQKVHGPPYPDAKGTCATPPKKCYRKRSAHQRLRLD